MTTSAWRSFEKLISRIEQAWDSGSILSLDARWIDDRFHVWYAAHSLEEAGKPDSEQRIRIDYYAVSDPSVTEHRTHTHEETLQ